MFEGCANPQRDYGMKKFENLALNKELEAKTCHNEKLNQTDLNKATEKPCLGEQRKNSYNMGLIMRPFFCQY